MHSTRVVSRGWSVLALALLLVGCGGENASSGQNGWTVNEGALALERDLLVSDTESFYFGAVVDVAPAADGRIVVADAGANHMKVLGPDGALQDSIGRKGQGPGEFERLRDVAVARGDSIYALDGGQRRISVFDPAGELAYTVSASLGQGFPRRLMIPRERSGLVLEHFMPTFATTGNRGTDVARLLDATGSVVDSIVGLTRSPMHQVSRGEAQMFLPIPFMPSNHVALGPEDRLHVARGDSLTVVQYTLDGSRVDTVAIPFEPSPVTGEDEDRVLREYGEERPMPRSKIPETKPAVEELLVDDQGRYWFGRPTPHSDSTDWWVADPEAKRVATARLPANVNLTAVRKGFAYGETSTEVGAPAVVRYRVHLPE